MCCRRPTDVLLPQQGTCRKSTFTRPMKGLYLYNAKSNALKKINSEDLAATGRQPFVKDAPVNLIFVADYSRAKNGRTDDNKMYTAMDAAYVSENVYLYCASRTLPRLCAARLITNACKSDGPLRKTRK